MALSKDKKAEVVSEVLRLLDNSKLTVVTKYEGTTVKSIQALRHQARDNGTQLRVVKNRLFKKVLEQSETFKKADSSALQGQLLYAFNPQDEVAPAQVLANFAKNEPQIQFVGAFTADGSFIIAEDVKALAALPNKDVLRAQLVGTIAAPISGFVNVMAGNVRGVLNVLQARADQIS